MSDGWLTISEAAELLAVHPKTIRRRIADGTLTASRMGPRLIRIHADDVTDWLHRVPTAERRVGRVGEGVLSVRGAPGEQVQGGALCFEGTRIPVATVLGFLDARGGDDGAILAAYPSLTQTDLDAARRFDENWQLRPRRRHLSEDQES